ncbi:LysM peptidoglycan-binding domain-containing protein [Kroppenstedtia pulmonis]|uniref:LysM peptidoglycan-binding domain-containing protein n=1 Tax=Kroppenstedtia pulmonis TaxID=1380685 RepID=A0A7D3Y171_9BACL|nr:LysM domain-containing protein [Kroppenstedtia pulmonis]QKG84123.1 LysM peptidoglycan-binding domain-containing protein [Kroppenstedtia pulmonis]
MKLHVVQSGDTLWKIAQRYRVSLQKLVDANPHIDGSDQLEAGVRVKIPTGKVPVSATPRESKKPEPQENAEQDMEANVTKEVEQEDSPLLPPMPEAPNYQPGEPVIPTQQEEGTSLFSQFPLYPGVPYTAGFPYSMSEKQREGKDSAGSDFPLKSDDLNHQERFLSTSNKPNRPPESYPILDQSGSPCHPCGAHAGASSMGGIPPMYGGGYPGMGIPPMNGGGYPGMGIPPMNGGGYPGMGIPPMYGGGYPGMGIPPMYGGGYPGMGIPPMDGGGYPGMGIPPMYGGGYPGMGIPPMDGGGYPDIGIPPMDGGGYPGMGIPEEDSSNHALPGQDPDLMQDPMSDLPPMPAYEEDGEWESSSAEG